MIINHCSQTSNLEVVLAPGESHHKPQIFTTNDMQVKGEKVRNTSKGIEIF